MAKLPIDPRAISRPGSLAPMSTTVPQALTRPNPGQATQAPIGSVGQGESSLDAYDLLTQVGPNADGRPPILYNGDRRWVKVTMILQTAGIVVWGPRADLSPITSGRGSQLVTNVPTIATVAKGSRIYYLASAVNRVSVQIEALPWLEEITALVTTLTGR